MNAADCVVVATVGRPFGVRGWVHIHSHTDPPHNLIDFAAWYLSTDARDRELRRIEPRIQKQAGKRLIATWEPMATRDDAARATGREIFVPAADLPPLDLGEYYWNDLIGLDVVNREGVALGVVERLVTTGPHDVLVIRGDRTHYVPFVASYVDDVVVDQKIVVDWLEAWSE